MSPSLPVLSPPILPRDEIMLSGPLLHPDILRVLAQAGHHAKVLIADGNYPASNKRGPRAELVSLQVAPGVPTVAQVFAAILGAVRIDEVNSMGVDRADSYAAATPGDPPVWDEYRRILAAAGSALDLVPIVKWEFYEAVASADHVLTIQTADTAPWANLLLTLGCRTFETSPGPGERPSRRDSR
jgi:L-fucose mutarotase